jgi:hypothetical protein
MAAKKKWRTKTKCLSFSTLFYKTMKWEIRIDPVKISAELFLNLKTNSCKFGSWKMP